MVCSALPNTSLTDSSNSTFCFLSRVMIFIAMVLYCLVGIEILKRKHAWKSIDSDSVPLETLELGHFNNAVAATVEVNVQSQPGHTAAQVQGKTESVMSSRGSTSISHLRPSENLALDHSVYKSPSRSSVSFRQYILMPLMFFVVLLAIWVAPTVNRVSSFINPAYVSYPLLLAVGSTNTLRGFWNGVVFITIGMKALKRKKELGNIGNVGSRMRH
jgi:hypothetical protein